MDDLAQAAGVTKPVFYQHFPSKRALFVAVLEDVGRAAARRCSPRRPASVETGRARVEAGLRRLLPLRRERPRRVPPAVRRVGPQRPRVRRRRRRRARQRGRRGEHAHRDPGLAEHRLVLAHAVVGIAEGISRHALTDPDGPHNPDQLADWVAELAWFGLRGVRSED